MAEDTFCVLANQETKENKWTNYTSREEKIAKPQEQ